MCQLSSLILFLLYCLRLILIVPHKPTKQDAVPYRLCLPDKVNIDGRSKAQLRARGLMYKAGDGEACIQVRWGLPEGGGRVDGVRGPALGEGREFVMKGGKAKQTPLKCKHVVPWLLPQEMYTVSGNRISITKEGERQVLELNFVRFGVI